MSYALITGGASGIGRGFANALADLGYNLILTSRNLDQLAQARKEIQQKYNNKVCIFVADLKDLKARTGLFEYAANYDISVLVNNAGFGDSQEFLVSDLAKEFAMIDLNVIALHHIFKHFYSEFRKKKSGRIINVSSLASFVPGPYAATYYATKAYVTSLTKAVAKEAKRSGVKVQVVNPGNTKTNFYKTAGTKQKYYKTNPNKVARLAVNSKRVVVIPGIKNKITYFFMRILPSSFTASVAGRIQRKQKSK